LPFAGSGRAAAKPERVKMEESRDLLIEAFSNRFERRVAKVGE
jgi:hypothetical protein